MVVIDCTLTGASPPTATLPTCTWRVGRRGIMTSRIPALSHRSSPAQVRCGRALGVARGRAPGRHHMGGTGARAHPAQCLRARARWHAEPFAFRAKQHQFTQPMIDADAPRAAAPELAALLNGGAYAGGAPAEHVARSASVRQRVEPGERRRATGRAAYGAALAEVAARAGRIATSRSANPPNPDHVVVKTVSSAFCSEWIARHCIARGRGVDAQRSPAERDRELARLRMEPAVRPAVTRDACTRPRPLGRRTAAARQRPTSNGRRPPPARSGTRFIEARLRNPDWVDISHEDLCVEPPARFADVAARLGLEWSDDAAAQLASRDRPGTGYATNRVTADQPDRWRTRLAADDRRVAGAILERFPAAPWLATLP